MSWYAGTGLFYVYVRDLSYRASEEESQSIIVVYKSNKILGMLLPISHNNNFHWLHFSLNVIVKMWVGIQKVNKKVKNNSSPWMPE